MTCSSTTGRLCVFSERKNKKNRIFLVVRDFFFDASPHQSVFRMADSACETHACLALPSVRPFSLSQAKIMLEIVYLTLIARSNGQDSSSSSSSAPMARHTIYTTHLIAPINHSLLRCRATLKNIKETFSFLF